MHTHLVPSQWGHKKFVAGKLAELDDAVNSLEQSGAGAPGFDAPNGDSVTIEPGTPVAVAVADGQVRRAWASSQAQSSVLGLASNTAAPTLPVRVQPDGALALTAAQWDARTGGTGGLAPGGRYYVDDAVPGRITTTPPSGPGTYIAALGRALSETILVLHIQSFVAI